MDRAMAPAPFALRTGTLDPGGNASCQRQFAGPVVTGSYGRRDEFERERPGSGQCPASILCHSDTYIYTCLSVTLRTGLRYVR